MKTTRAPLIERIPNLRRIEEALVKRGLYKYDSNREACEARGGLAINVWTGYSQSVYQAADEIAVELDCSRYDVTAVGDYINVLIR